MWYIYNIPPYFYVFVVVKLRMGLLKPKNIANIVNKKGWLPINFFRGGKEKNIACEGSIFHADESTNVGTISNNLSWRKECY